MYRCRAKKTSGWIAHGEHHHGAKENSFQYEIPRIASDIQDLMVDDKHEILPHM
jgi:hypothetical protein